MGRQSRVERKIYAGGYRKEEKWKKVNSKNTLNYNQSYKQIDEIEVNIGKCTLTFQWKDTLAKD